MKRLCRHLGLILILSMSVIGATACTASHTTELPLSPPPPTSQAAQHPSPEPAAAEYVPVFESAECQFSIPEGHEVECGYLIVPEDRSRSGGSSVRLPVAIFKSTSSSPAPDPVVHLVGGPGGNLLDSSAFYLGAGGERILETRDYVLFNQRGTHYAEPSLECPGQVEFGWELAGQQLDEAGRDAQEIEFLLGCRDALLEKGINLAAYGTADNAADVRDLRIALGYEQVNLYGISYGTRLALTIMRDHPEGIRSVILDSVFPPQVDLDHELASNANRAFTTLFEGCAADTGCRTQYPNLEEVFYQVIAELEANPKTVPIKDGTIDAWVDADIFMDAIFGSLYRVDAIVWLPRMIYEVSEGNLAAIQIPLEVMYDFGSISWGMHYSVGCREEIPFESYEDSLRRAADLPPPIAEHFASPFVFTVCESWASGQADPIENEPVACEIPTLVLSGQYDPITPPGWGRSAADTLSNSFFYEFPGIGHGVMRSSACGLKIGLQFLNDPLTEPDVSCMDELDGPAFH